MDYFFFQAKIGQGEGVLCDALIVRRGRIAAVGREGELYPRAGGCAFIPCGGRRLIPGFTDACLCLQAAGSDLPVGKEGLQQAVQTVMTGQRGKGRHLFWRSCGEELSLRETEALWPHSPLFLEDVAARRGWANGAALALLLKEGLPPNLAPYVARDDTGAPTGVLSGPACRYLAGRLPHLSGLALKNHWRQLLEKAALAGLTRVTLIDPLLFHTGWDRPVLEQLYGENHRLPELRIFTQTPGTRDPLAAGAILPVRELSRALWQPGQLVLPAEDGPAIDRVLAALEDNPQPPGNFRRLTLLGAGCTSPRQLQELGRLQLGVIAFAHRLEETLCTCAGQIPAQPETCCAWRTLGALGCHLAFGGLDTLCPMAAVQKAVCRPDKEALTLSDALDGWTVGSAWTDFREDSLGRLLPGYRADLQVLDRDVFTLPPEDLASVRPVLVMSGGQLLHREI